MFIEVTIYLMYKRFEAGNSLFHQHSIYTVLIISESGWQCDEINVAKYLMISLDVAGNVTSNYELSTCYLWIDAALCYSISCDTADTYNSSER